MENTLLRVEKNVISNIIFLKSVEKNELKFFVSVMNFKTNFKTFHSKVSPCMSYLKVVMGSRFRGLRVGVCPMPYALG